jgi:hypothetical protein
MGVPGLLNWLKTRYPLIFQPASLPSRPKADYLFIDFSSWAFVAHREAPGSPTDVSGFRDALLRHLDDIVRIVRPGTFIFITLDHGSPRLKAYTQQTKNDRLSLVREDASGGSAPVRAPGGKTWRRRKAKAKAAHDHDSEPGKAEEAEPDEQAEEEAAAEEEEDRGKEVKKPRVPRSVVAKITIGKTESRSQIPYPVWKAIPTMIKDHIERQLQEDGLWKGLTVIFAPQCGEGEQAIMRFIREQRKLGSWDENAVCCFSSQDADMMLLALQNRVRHAFVLQFPAKKDALKPPLFLYLNVLRDYLELEFGVDDTDQLVDDLLLTIALLGNDFIPSMFAGAPRLEDVPEYEMLGQILPDCFQIYRDFFFAEGRFLTCGDDIQTENFGEFAAAIGAAFDAPNRDFLHAQEFAHCALDRLTWVFRYNKTGQVDPQWTPPDEYRVIPSLRIVGQYAGSFEATIPKPGRAEPMRVTSFKEKSTKNISVPAFRVQLGARDDHYPAGLPSLLRFPPVAVRIPDIAGVVTLVQSFPVDISFAASACGKVVVVNWPYFELGLVEGVIDVGDAAQSLRHGIEYGDVAKLFSVKVLKFDTENPRQLIWAPKVIKVPIQATLPFDAVPEILEMYRPTS